MPTYSNRCNRPGCGAIVDVVCKMDDRNNPKPCSELVGLADRKGPLAACDGTGVLERAQENETIAATPYSWKP